MATANIMANKHASSSITTTSPKKSVDVTITSDLMCPWCYVGLRKLQEASKVTGVEPKITWKPFMLRPNLPENGVAKGGTPESRVPSHLKEAGESVGIRFTGLTDKTPNTKLFHATMKMLLEDEEDLKKQTEFQEAVFDAYFTQGIFPDADALLEAADKVGVKESVVKLYGDAERLEMLREEVTREALEASRRGVHGVPFFAFNGEPAFSGAQNVNTFVQFLEEYAK